MSQDLVDAQQVTIKDYDVRTAVEATYLRLKHDLLCGFLPPGSKLRIEHLRPRYKVGGSTIREALTRLTADQLVLMEGQKGFKVAEVSLKDLEDLTNVRLLLECSSLRDSIKNGTEEWEVALISAFHRLRLADERLQANPETSFDEWEQRNREFHDTLVSGAKSVWLQRLRSIVFQQSERYRRLSSALVASRQHVHEEHRAIFEAAMSRNSELAENLLRHHIQRSVKQLAQSDVLK